MKIVQVISTFGSPPLVHLQLEAGRRFTPGVPTLVFDDHSSEQRELLSLCENYGAVFQSSDHERGHHHGAAWAAARGIEWAMDQGADLCFFRVRRFIPLHDWTKTLAVLASASPLPTFGNHSLMEFMEMRFDAWACRPAEWIRTGAVGLMERGCRNTHSLVRACSTRAAGKGRYERSDRPFALWESVPCDRWQRKGPPHLWRHNSWPWEYSRLGEQWGLPYPPLAYRPVKSCE